MKKKLITWLLNHLQSPRYWKVGDRFTVVNWINSSDKSWVGSICEITMMKSNLIMFDQISTTLGYETRTSINHRWFVIGQDFNIRPL